MINECLARDSEFGIVWLSDDGLRDIGCACRIERVLERMDDGRMNLLTRGTRPFRRVERQGHLAYPAGVVEFLGDEARRPMPGSRGAPAGSMANSCGAPPIVSPTARRARRMSAYEMAATVDFGLDAKQGLLDLRSENARLALLTRLLRAAPEAAGLRRARAVTRALQRQGPLQRQPRTSYLQARRRSQAL